MQVNLSKKFLSPCKYYIDVTEYLFIIGNLVINYSSMIYNSFEIYLRVINFSVHEIPVKVVKFIKIERTFVIRYDVEKKHFSWILFCVSRVLSFN